MVYRLMFLIALWLTASVSLASDAAQNDYRIPNTFRIDGQAVSLSLDPNAKGYSGETTLSLTVLESTDRLVLHWTDLSVSSIELTGGATARLLNATALDLDQHALADGEAIEPGKYRLSLQFEGEYSLDALGLYKVTVENSHYLFTQFEAMFARRAFPLVDEPSTKIPWDVTITSPASLKVAANTPVIQETSAAGWTTRQFATTPPMPSYLLALIVGDFDVTAVPNEGTPIQIFSPKGTGSTAGYASRVTPRILKALETYFDLPYPYQKLDFVAVPDFTFGAMENAGLVTYRSELLLNGDNPTPNSAFYTVMVIAHELAHQWYGNLVTMAWWDDLWLNEAFAEWMAYKITTDLHPEFSSDLHLPQSGAFPADALGATRPIRKIVRDEEDVTDGLGLNYSKGHGLLNMLEQAIGENAFRTGIRAYMRKHSWGNTTASNLWDALGTQAAFDVGEVAETFLNQAGFPLVTFEPNGNVTQRRFNNVGSVLPNQQWRVPMSILVANKGEVTNLRLTLADEQQLEPKLAGATWLMPTAGGNGYFVWYTGEKAYANLLNQLDALTDREKLAVLVNGKQLLSAGVVGLEQHMALTTKMTQQTNQELVLQSLEEVRMVAEMYRGTHVEEPLRQWVSDLLGPWYEKLGLAAQSNDTESAVKLRARIVRILAQLGDSPALRKEMAAMADVWLKDASEVDAGIAIEALRVNALVNGTKTTAERYVNTYINSTDAVVKSTLRSAMYFAEPEAFDVVLKAMAEGSINAGDMASMLSGLFYANIDQAALYQSYRDRFEAIHDQLPQFYRSLMPQITGVSCSSANLERQRAFYQERGEKFSTAIRKSQESASNCISTRSRELERVDQYLSGL